MLALYFFNTGVADEMNLEFSFLIWKFTIYWPKTNIHDDQTKDFWLRDEDNFVFFSLQVISAQVFQVHFTQPFGFSAEKYWSMTPKMIWYKFRPRFWKILAFLRSLKALKQTMKHADFFLCSLPKLRCW